MNSFYGQRKTPLAIRSFFKNCPLNHVHLSFTSCFSKHTNSKHRKQNRKHQAHPVQQSPRRIIKDELPVSATILSTSLADINHLSKTTTLGRVLGEQLSSAMSDIGYNLIEIKMKNSVFISQHNAGEFSLSRSLDNLSKAYNADAVVTGTYAVGSNTVYISARMIDIRSKRVVATTDFQIPLDADIRMLVRNRKKY
ncbi:FlgO family outer membrane protein [uncultured Endozoicomonas sp.]|uniref:FlgO family outer membrane protein n=1 Tax=uncultured Endozoicomonas sp. TaxID=432652 RepID=UPI0034198729